MADNQDESSPFLVPKLCIKRAAGQHILAKKPKLVPTAAELTENASSAHNEQSNAGGGSLKLVLRVPKDCSDPASSNDENADDGHSSEKDSEASKDSHSVDSESMKLSSFLPSNQESRGTPDVEMSGNEDSAVSSPPPATDETSDDMAASPKRRRRRKRFRLTTPAQKIKSKMYREMQAAETPEPARPKRGQKKEEIVVAVEEKPAPPDQSAVDASPSDGQQQQFPSPSQQMLANFSPLQLLLDHLLKGFLKKDPERYFAYPVTEDIAPNYSSIVSQPMDFLSIRKKIDDGEYMDLNQFKADIGLISSNAMLYNQKNTIFYLAAKKLQNVSEYMFSKEKLNATRRLMPQLVKLRPHELGLTTPEEEARRQKEKARLGHYACIVDDMYPEEIIEQVRSASAAAKEKLNATHPRIEVLFASSQDDETKPTTLKMLMPEHVHDREESGSKKVVLGDLVPKLKEGTPGLPRPDFSKDSVVPVTYLDNGPFSSFAPHYDSTWATLNKEESDLLLASFGGDEPCVRFIDSIRTFVQDTNENLFGIAESMVDDIVNDPVPPAPAPVAEALDTQTHTDLNSGTTNPNEVGADSTSIQQMLDANAVFLQELFAAQNQRLNTQPPFVLTHAPGPSEVEVDAAAKVVVNLQQMTSLVPPAQLVAADTVREALMGTSKDSEATNTSDDYNMDVLREFFEVDS